MKSTCRRRKLFGNKILSPKSWVQLQGSVREIRQKKTAYSCNQIATELRLGPVCLLSYKLFLYKLLISPCLTNSVWHNRGSSHTGVHFQAFLVCRHLLLIHSPHSVRLQELEPIPSIPLSSFKNQACIFLLQNIMGLQELYLAQKQLPPEPLWIEN